MSVRFGHYVPALQLIIKGKGFVIIKLLTGISVGLMIGVSGFTFHFASGTSYLSKDPRACLNCHIMRDQFDSWEKSSHHAVAGCVDCHIPRKGLAKWSAKIDNGFQHSTAFTLQNFHEPIQITSRNSKILQSNCLECHASIASQLVGFGYSDTSEMSCVRCHIQVGHGASN